MQEKIELKFMQMELVDTSDGDPSTKEIIYSEGGSGLEMAKKDTITFKTGQQTASKTCTNIHFSVGGHNAGNGPADTMLVQAIFNYIGKSNTSVLGFSLQSSP